MVTLGGCKPDSQITQYAIPKPESIQLPPPENLPPTQGSPAAKPSRPERMLGAIVAREKQLWFFKLTGPIDPVGARADEFRAYLMSLRYDDKDEPSWTLPEGWRQQPGSGMRFATLLVGDEEPLELSVIALPNVGGELAPQILANVNRWRGQLTLPPIDLDQLGKDTETVTTPDGVEVTVVDYTGVTKGDGMMSAPFARGMGFPGMGAGATAAPLELPSAPAQVKYETPDGWEVGKVGGMRKAALDITDGAQKAEVTVIDLAEEAGERLPNVNRWRGQIGLEPVTAEELAKTMHEIPVGSLTGDYVELVGPADAAKPQTILGVIVEHGGKAWFLKLQGDSELALAQKAKFEAFVKSVRFE
ncbi:MAG: hypothetical protein B7Z55_00245 [Planctomycetales bacterium 12-60-4]|nr:MAG: hypothetical protein B7Z55_00245 [Planctomycetales bacterium 12-60-4]